MSTITPSTRASTLESRGYVVSFATVLGQPGADHGDLRLLALHWVGDRQPIGGGLDSVELRVAPQRFTSSCVLIEVLSAAKTRRRS